MAVPQLLPVTGSLVLRCVQLVTQTFWLGSSASWYILTPGVSLMGALLSLPHQKPPLLPRLRSVVSEGRAQSKPSPG